MPYINKKDRTPDMSNSIACLVNEIESKGDLNYTICQLTAELIRKTGGMGYTNVSNWIDGVHGAERELTRRLLNPYEDVKIEENGDVEGFVTLLAELKRLKMGTRADFYIGVRDPKWIGSLSMGGHPWSIACKLLIQVNETMFEETVVDFLETKPGGNIQKWMWPWEDSQMTDYSYFFSHAYGKVYAYSAKEKMMFDPLKIMQGEDLNSARVEIDVTFPKMGVDINGQEVTTTL